jgi:RHS repeat-associated protein
MKSSFSIYPFGSPIPNRSFSASSYRYGFNGKEKDDEVKGGGNSLDYGARIYDSRLGKWLSIDPLSAQYPDIAPYSFALNNVLNNIDVGGKFVKDKNGNVIVTITKKNDEYVIGGPTGKIDENGNEISVFYSIKGSYGKILTDAGSEVEIFIPSSKDVTKYTIAKSKEGTVVSSDGGVLQNPDDYEVGYNCTSNGLLKTKAFVISADEITPKVLNEEGYVNIDPQTRKIGDIGIYEPNGGELISHFEPFITEGTVSSKGGIAKDPGPKLPGQNRGFKKDATYEIIRKNTTDKVTDLVAPATGNNGTNTVDRKTFDKVKEEVKR